MEKVAVEKILFTNSKGPHVVCSHIEEFFVFLCLFFKNHDMNVIFFKNVTK